MRLEHLEEQSLRSNKATPNSKQAKPPRSGKKCKLSGPTNISIGSSDDSQNDDNFTDRLRITAGIANSPAKPKKQSSPSKLLTEITRPTCSEVRDFKKSVCYRALEQAVLLGEDIREREETIEGHRKIELESEQGSAICRSYLQCLERLFQLLEIVPVKKDYRLKFSKAYKVLYQSQEDSQYCCFLPEILDSAQEAFPFLWVNGEKYVFSSDVLTDGKALFSSFCTIRRYIARLTRKLQQTNEDDPCGTTYIKNMALKQQKLTSLLRTLDEQWA